MKNVIPTRSEMSAELLALAADMETAAKRLAYLGGFDPVAHDRAEELTGAASCVRQWSRHLKRRPRKKRA